MSTPVTASKWAGTYDCGTCRRKRLMGEEFSRNRKALERHRRDGSALKCKACVTADERAERESAAARRQRVGGDEPIGRGGSGETMACAGQCGRVLPKSSYNRNQLSKGDGRGRCRECVERSVEEDSMRRSKSRADDIAAARIRVQEARESGDARSVVSAESELAALEAERVTGLKPARLSSTGRGGRLGSRGRGSWRGRARGKGVR